MGGIKRWEGGAGGKKKGKLGFWWKGVMSIEQGEEKSRDSGRQKKDGE